MRPIWVYSGRPSGGAAYLAASDGFRRSRTGDYIKRNDVIVNWGTVGYIPGSKGCRILNLQDAVKKAVNKKITFQVLSEANIPTVSWTANRAIAQGWVNQGYTVVARKTLTGHEGAGIIIVEHGNELVEAPLYTRYIDKVKEFRVHATQYGVIDTQWKVRDPEREVTSWKVRSYKNGFIFQRKGIIPSAARDALAIQTIKALGLDFGGLDIIEDNQGNFYVLEVNTAPGIEGTTVERYVAALAELAHGRVHAVGPIGPGRGPVASAAPVGRPVGGGVKNLNRGAAPLVARAQGIVNLNKRYA